MDVVSLYVWASGVISISVAVPDGAIEVVKGAEPDLLLAAAQTRQIRMNPHSRLEVIAVADAGEDGFLAIEKLIAFRDAIMAELLAGEAVREFLS